MWSIFDVPGLPPRENPSVGKFGGSNICIMGGYSCGHLSDILLLDTANFTIKVRTREGFLKFSCQSSSYMSDEGSIVAMVADNLQVLHIVKYKGHENRLGIIETVGHV